MAAERMTGSRASSGSAAQGHFEFLDALRGLAALWVVLFHLTISKTLPAVDDEGPLGFVWNTLLGRGALGVAVFFVLSGFVISHSLRRGLDGAASFGSFMLRRIVRLSPPYWAAMVVAIVVHGLAVVVNDEPFAPGGAPLDLWRVLSHLVYLEGLVGHPYINDVFWTLTVEMQFYLVLALFLLVAGLLERWHRASFRVLVWAAAVGSVLAARSDLNPQSTFIPLFYSFFLGAVLYWFRVGRLGWWEVGLYLTGLGAVFVEEADAFLAASLATGLLLLAASLTGNGLASWLSAGPFRFLGRISYSLYLIHVPVQGAVLLAVVKVLGTGPVAVVIAVVSSTVASVAASVVFWWAVERPAMAWAAALKRPAAQPETSPQGVALA